jgi:ABC-type amino acid transport system permease subunit
MEPTLQFFSGLPPVTSGSWPRRRGARSDLGAVDLVGTLLGVVFGWVLYEGKALGDGRLAALLDVFRSVPLIIQLVLFYNLAPIIGLNLDAFASGVVS